VARDGEVVHPAVREALEAQEARAAQDEREEVPQ
jgi:hypothetical protein